MPKSQKCRASKRNGDPCGNQAVTGALVCRMHGGVLPVVKKAAAKRLVEESVRREIASLRDIAPMAGIGDVYADLLETAAVAQRWRRLLQDRVSYLNNLGYSTLESGEQIRADVQLFERSLERCAKIGEMLARLNLDERKQAVDERLAAQLGLAIQAILGELDLTEVQQAKATTVVPRKLRELTA